MKNILEMRRLREEGFSYQKIADIFNGKNIPSKLDGEWIWQSIRSVLNRQRMLDAEASRDAEAAISDNNTKFACDKGGLHYVLGL
jgi:hypothetical protein